jgi:hypothetical protein
MSKTAKVARSTRGLAENFPGNGGKKSEKKNLHHSDQRLTLLEQHLFPNSQSND